MANFHLNAKSFIDKLTFDKEIIVEIGSDNNEGSTEFFDSLGYEFHSVDVLADASRRLSHLQNTNWHIVPSGSVWASYSLPKLNKEIKVLYLDNYDWANPGPTANKIKAEYACRKVDWSNLGSQVEHLHQIIGCFPYMAPQSIVICDDTPMVEHHGTYTGKCGAVVPFLLVHGFKVVHAGNNGVILSRGL
jgi:hypothetical protein